MTLNWDTDVAGRACTRMANDFTVTMFTSFVFGFVTVLSTRVWQYHRVVIRFFPSTAVAEIFRQLVLCVSEVAVRACPSEKSNQPFCRSLGICHLPFIRWVLLIIRLRKVSITPLVFLLFFLLIILHVLFKRLV
jgi:hypothetical protein